MKNLLGYAFIAILSLTAAIVSAQTSPTKSASSTLNVVLANAYDIKVSQSSVSINMNNSSHFTSGNNSGKQKLHVVVSCNTGYEVKVAATTQLLNGSSSIPVNTVTVKPEIGDYLGGGTPPTPTDITLTDTALAVGSPKTLISKNSGETKRGYNIDYSISAADATAYMNKIPGNYSTTVTYSLFAK
jgi:hypothetical protein